LHPYKSLPDSSFWASAVAKFSMFDIGNLWTPKFGISKSDAVVTFGSCFAQHIGKALISHGMNWLNAELPPIGLSEANSVKFNYGIFSARTGNIYTPTLLYQWLKWVTGEEPPPEIWQKENRYFDPFRPMIEPNGFGSGDEMLLSRKRAVEAFQQCINSADIFVFTLGLTESWHNSIEGYEYPMCPGTIAGTFDPVRHAFVNLEYSDIYSSLNRAIKTMRKINSNLKFLLTVSPVPLTATMSGNHVLVATTESKSVLRAVAGSISRKFDYIDYFPSYEIICGTPYRGAFFDANLRTVNHAGVDHVMKQFFTCLNSFQTNIPDEAVRFPTRVNNEQSVELQSQVSARQQRKLKSRLDQVVCEEALLEAFGANKGS
jgi:GSCFA family